jgi:hypothetical protein
VKSTIYVGESMRAFLTILFLCVYSVLAAQKAVPSGEINPLTSLYTTVQVRNVTNKVKVGPLTGNKNLAFGVKNIVEEVVLDKGYDLSDSSELRLDLEIIYFDVQQTSTGVSVFHKTENETIIRIKGILYTDSKKSKEYIATGKSSEVSTSTMIIDEGGGFNQASARSALKKTIINLIDKLL